MQELKACPVCNHTDLKYLFTCKDYVASGELFKLNTCTNCTHVFTNPRPTEQEAGRYYQSDQYVSHSGTDKSKLGLTYKIYDIVRNFNINNKLGWIKHYHKNGNLLDLGCGLGYFLNGVIKDKTFNATGVDISEDALQYIQKNFGITGFPETHLDNFKDGEFTIITQWHVIEHVYQLQERLKQLKRILHKDGTMFIAVPNSASWDAKYYKQFWDGFDVPRHIHHYTPKSFKYLFEHNGFEIIKTKGMLFDAPYICMRSEYHQKNSLGFIKGAFFGLISTISAYFTGNHSSLLYIIKHK